MRRMLRVGVVPAVTELSYRDRNRSAGLFVKSCDDRIEWMGGTLRLRPLIRSLAAWIVFRTSSPDRFSFVFRRVLREDC